MKKVLVVWITVLLMFPHYFAFANLIINEIMYAPSTGSDYEWVEIFNSGSESVDLNNYRFFHGETNSGPLTLRNGTTTILQSFGYAIIAKSQTNYAWLNFSGMILSASTVSLPDSGDNTYIAISDPDKIILDSLTYDTSLGGSKESGNSLQKISGTWIGKTPTPGVVNEASISSGDSATGTSNDNNSSDQNINTSETKAKITEESKIKTKITTQSLAFAGIPVSFQATAFGLQGEILNNGKYFWNFGDGDSREVKGNENQKFTRTYFYAGEYTVTLEYYSNYYSNIPDASDKIIIKIVPADIVISKVGDEKDFFVELSNNTSYNTDISNWILTSITKSFTIPRNTTIASKNKIIISSKITNFSILDKDSLKLITAQGNLAFDYTASIVPQKLITQEQNRSQDFLLRNVNYSPDLAPVLPTQNENLKASVISSDIVKDNPMRTYILTTIMTVFLGMSAGAVYFIRQKKTISNTGDDFSILDE